MLGKAKGVNYQQLPNRKKQFFEKLPERFQRKEAIEIGASAEDLFRLGLMYSTELEDRGPDYVEAHKWFNLAAMMGSMPAKSYREEIKLEMSSDDLTLAQRAARGWLAENRKLLVA